MSYLVRALPVITIEVKFRQFCEEIKHWRMFQFFPTSSFSGRFSRHFPRRYVWELSQERLAIEASNFPWRSTVSSRGANCRKACATARRLGTPPTPTIELSKKKPHVSKIQPRFAGCGAKSSGGNELTSGLKWGEPIPYRSDQTTRVQVVRFHP